jgi:hypothetical protein
MLFIEAKMNTDEEKVIVICPDCAHEIDLGPMPEKGETLTCPECWAYLVVSSLDPLELKWNDADIDEEEWELEEDL